MSENNTPENIIPIPAEAIADAPAAEAPKPQTIQELVAAIDISGVSEHEIIVDLISGIQQLALRGTIALGLLERLKTEGDAADQADADPSANAAPAPEADALAADGKEA
jgi:hypothetical protein